VAHAVQRAVFCFLKLSSRSAPVINSPYLVLVLVGESGFDNVVVIATLIEDRAGRRAEAVGSGLVSESGFLCERREGKTGSYSSLSGQHGRSQFPDRTGHSH